MNVVAEVNPRVVIGNNNPPEPLLSPFEQSRDEIENLWIEACNWADGTPIENQQQADAIGKLRADIKTAAEMADKRRVIENKPFDDGKAEVQARYADLIADTKSKKGKTVLALEALNKVLQPWLVKLEDEKRAAAKKAREEAEAAAAKAQEALRSAQASADLEAKAAAETLITEAKRADVFANRAEDAKAHVYGGARAVGLRTTYRPEITDMQAFARFVWTTHFDDLAPALGEIAKTLVSRGIRTMPGVTVHEERGL